MAIWKEGERDETISCFGRESNDGLGKRSVIFTKKATSIVEEAVIDDLPNLTDIHRRSFAHGWSESDFQTLFRDKTVESLVLKRSGLLITEQVVGFVLARRVLDESEILTIAMDPAFRKTGGGRLLMEELMRRLYRDRIAKLFLEVDASNKPALSLYDSLGFRKVGERKGYYRTATDAPSLAWIMQIDVAGK